MMTHKTTLLFFTLFAVSLFLISSAHSYPTAKTSREFTLRVDGTPGVKLRVLLVHKSSKNGKPRRELKNVTTPYQLKFKASSFYVWFDNIVGEAGDRIMGSYFVSGELQGGGFGATLKKPSNRKTFEFGNL